MNQRSRKLLIQIASLLLGVGLLYLALRNVDLSTIWDALRGADYRYIAPLLVIIIFSHWLRAWRWTLMLDALPRHGSPEEKARRHSVKIAFYSVMIGYMVNYAAPRLGELARSANVATQEKTRFSAVLGTVVAERILDLTVLAVALVSVLLLYWHTIFEVDVLAAEPFLERLGDLRYEHLAAVSLAALLAGGAIYLLWRFISRGTHKRSKIVRQRIKASVSAFRTGIVSLFKTKRNSAIIGSTVLMWFCYVLMAHIPFIMLGMADTYNITLLDSWAIMVIGVIGVVIPSPGGIGSYHYITKQTLVLLFAVSEAPAVSYAVLTHAAQLILYTLIGFVCVLLQGSSLKSLTESARTARPGIS